MTSTGSSRFLGSKRLSLPIAVLLLLSLSCYEIHAQEDDDVVLIDDTEQTMEALSENATLFQQQSKLDPQTASIYSAVLPGLGQAYNGHYWKIPIIYAGGLAFLQIVQKNNELYRAFRNALFNEIDLDPNTSSPFGDRFSEDALRRNTDQFRRDRDFFIIIGLIWYGLNIVDAHVSAHLDEFNVNDDLSMRVFPSVFTVPTAPYALGLTVSLNFKG